MKFGSSEMDVFNNIGNQNVRDDEDDNSGDTSLHTGNSRATSVPSFVAESAASKGSAVKDLMGKISGINEVVSVKAGKPITRFGDSMGRSEFETDGDNVSSVVESIEAVITSLKYPASWLPEGKENLTSSEKFNSATNALVKGLENYVAFLKKLE